MTLRGDEYEQKVRRGEDAQTRPADILVNIFRDIDVRVAAIETTAASIAELQAAMVADAQALIDDAVGPLVAKIRAAADLGVVFTTTSPTTLAVGTGTRTLVVPEALRPAFAPAAMLAIAATEDPAVVLWCRKLSWDKTSGSLVVEVLSADGSGEHTGWTIAPGQAATMAGHLSVAEAGLVPAGNLQAALAVLSGALGNDPGFAAAVAASLAERPTASAVAAGLEGKQAAAATLGVLASIEAAGDSFPYFTSPTAGNRTPLTSYMREVLAMADDAAARTKLGAAAAHNPSITGNLRFGSRAPVDGIFYAGAGTSRVFVYDTRIDTDSGRWRSRGQGTRAFTTPAGADRGARRDFPAIAVIAYDTANRARIYDAEAVAASGVPALWANVAMPTSGTVRQIKALNGVLCVAASNGLSVYDLLSDVRSKFDATGVTTYPGSAAGGLVAYTTGGTDAARAIVSTDVKGVDMRALAGAPLGFGLLPIPTIVLATAAGASVLHASGAVVDITRASGYVAVDIVSDTQLKLVTPEGDVELGPIPAADITNTAWRTSVRSPSFGGPTRIAGPAEGTPRGLLMRYPNAADDAASLTAHIGPAFNTGWMPANVRRALFCDNALGARTAATPLADDCSSTTGWILGAGWTLDTGEFDHASGTAALDRALSGLTSGVRYRARFLVGNRSAGSLAVSLLTAGDEAGALSVAANGEHVIGFTASATTDTLRFVPTTDFNGSIQDVRVEVAVADRGPAGRDARANGVLTMTAGVGEISHAVGWGAANFVDDSYTADLDFGADFCVSFNLYSGPGDATIVQRASAPTSGARWEVGVTESASVYYWTFSISDGAASASVTAPLGVLNDRIHMAFVRRGATIEIWRGGVLAASAPAAVGSLANAAAGIRYGARVDGSRPMISFTQLKSLVIAASAPTADQIAEMARQDRTTSQANALCCLGGASAAVAAVDYDPITEQVAVAAAGVSTFRGMLRTSYVSTLNSLLGNNAVVDVAVAGATIATASPAGGFCYRSELAAVMVESGGVGGAPAMHGHDPATETLPGFMSAADKAVINGISAFSKTVLDDASAAAWRATIGAQASDAELTALAALTSAASKLPYFTGSGTAGLADFRPRTLNGRTAVDLLRRPNTPQRRYVTGATWLSSTTPADNNWNAVCWAPELGLFAAVSSTGTGNRVMTSPDGITWTARTSAADNDWIAICWSPELGLFAACAISGTGNRVMTSPDGVNWTARTTPVDNEWRAICWAPGLGLFVAVAYSGTGNRVMTSPDGINWTARTSASDNSWYAIAWSEELRVLVVIGNAGASQGRSMYSFDGINWTNGGGPGSRSWRGVCWSPGRRLFVASGVSGDADRIATSTDGISWTQRTTPTTNNFTAVCWSPELGAFAAVAASGAGNLVMYSPDGQAWTMGASAVDNQWSAVCWSPELGLFCAVAYSGTGNRAMTSVSAFKYPYRS